MYPDLVRQFYANLEIQSPPSAFKTYVNDQPFLVSPIIIGRALNLHSQGKPFPNDTTKLPCSEKTAKKFWEKVLVRNLPLNIDSSSLSNNLVEPAYTLHKLIAFNILPKGGNFDRVTREAIICLFLLYTNKPFQITELIYQLMVDASKSTTSILPFGSWITHILIYSKVDLDTEYVFDRFPPIAYPKREPKAGASSSTSSSSSVAIEGFTSTLARIEGNQTMLLRNFNDYALAVKNDLEDIQYSFNKMAQHFNYDAGYMRNPSVIGNRIGDLTFEAIPHQTDVAMGEDDEEEDEDDEDDQSDDDDGDDDDDDDDNDDSDGDEVREPTPPPPRRHKQVRRITTPGTKRARV